MDADSAPPSPRCGDGWMLVDKPGGEALEDSKSRFLGSSTEAAAGSSSEQDDIHDGMKSPESERLADDLLREPYQAVGLVLQLAAPPAAPAVEEPATPTAGSGPYTASCTDLSCHHCADSLHHATDLTDFVTAAAHAPQCGGGGDSSGAGSGGSCWGCERQQERLRAAIRLSGEGALEGFQDPQDLLLADASAPGAVAQIGTAGDAASDTADAPCGGPVVSLGWEALASNVWSDVLRELEDMRALVATTAAALWERVQDGRMAVEEWALAVRAAAHQAAKSAGRSGCPLWALIGISGLAAMALAALVGQMVINRRLAAQLRQRDRDLARLVVKILNLQDALQTAARTTMPVMRHTSLERFTTTTTTTLIGMV